MSVFDPYKQVLQRVEPVGLAGRVRGVRGLTVTVSDFAVGIGAACRIDRVADPVEARVIGFAGERTVVMPLGAAEGICRGDRVELVRAAETVGVGPDLLGRVIDGRGRPIDGAGRLRVESQGVLRPAPLDPMRRPAIDEPLPVGVRAIDAMLTVGRGQRMGVFSGPGVGKSLLLGMIARHAAADVTVIALIGERGREVREFLDKHLGAEGRRRAVVVVSTGDEPPLLRVQAAAAATCVAEYFRDRGRNVLLLMDSLTRLAMAQRQIGLVAGEPPATRGYPPSVFALLPELLERAVRTAGGSITGFYTVLVEGDESADPIAEAVRAATDGHVHLSAELAQRGHWPAIDVLRSVSRAMGDVVDPGHATAAEELRRLIALREETADLLRIGAYKPGGDAEVDRAVAAMPRIRELLTQRPEERAEFGETVRALKALHAQAMAAPAANPARVGPGVSDGE